MPPKTGYKGTETERFWAKVQKGDGVDDCWLWQAYTLTKGYGQFTIIKNNQTKAAHRLAYEWEYGPIPEELELDHLCRTKSCVRPNHLEAVPHIVNVLRGTAPSAQNAIKTHCIHGHLFDLVNTYFGSDGRACRTCNRLNKRKARCLE